jgi:hypothetical protein
MPAGSTLLADQLSALDELHKYLVEWVQTFRRRFRHGRASLLTSLDATSLKTVLENVHYQGPMKLEVPFGEYSTSNGDSMSFNVALPTAAFTNKRSVLKDALRVLLGDSAAGDRKYWAQTTVKGKPRNMFGEKSEASSNVLHPLLQHDDQKVTAKSDKVSVGTVQVRLPMQY